MIKLPSEGLKQLFMDPLLLSTQNDISTLTSTVSWLLKFVNNHLSLKHCHFPLELIVMWDFVISTCYVNAELMGSVLLAIVPFYQVGDFVHRHLITLI